MIVDTLSNMKLYKELLPPLLTVEKFIYDHKYKENIQCCKYLIDNENIFALVQQYETKESEDLKWESHSKYLDVQFILEGEEAIGYAPIEALTLEGGFAEENDIAFYNGPRAYTNITLSAGMFAIFYPGEGHLPCCISEKVSNVKKIVFKIKLN
ncbi:MAG: YhcH/YjgK/YiaL family protein [Ruminiclostridium sp.]